MKPHSYQVGQETQLGSLGIMVNVIVLRQTVCTQAGLEHLAASGYPLDPADVARLTPLGHPTINLDGRYRTTSRPPTTGLRPLRTDLLRILYRSSSQADCPRCQAPAGSPCRTRGGKTAVKYHTARQTTLLVRLNGPVIDPAWAVEEPNLEEIVLGYMGQAGAGHGAGPGEARLSAVGGNR